MCCLVYVCICQCTLAETHCTHLIFVSESFACVRFRSDMPEWWVLQGTSIICDLAVTITCLLMGDHIYWHWELDCQLPISAKWWWSGWTCQFALKHAKLQSEPTYPNRKAYASYAFRLVCVSRPWNWQPHVYVFMCFCICAKCSQWWKVEWWLFLTRNYHL